MRFAHLLDVRRNDRRRHLAQRQMVEFGPIGEAAHGACVCGPSVFVPDVRCEELDVATTRLLASVNNELWQPYPNDRKAVIASGSLKLGH